MDTDLIVVLLGTLSGLVIWTWGSSLAARYLAPTRALPPPIDRLGRMRPPNTVLNLWGVIVTLIAGALGPIGIALRLRQEPQAGPLDLSVVILVAGIALCVAWAAVLLVSILRAPTR
jgi:hypothetical protein